MKGDSDRRPIDPALAAWMERWRFRTKSAVQFHIRQMLDRYADNQRLGAEDEVFMRSLIEIHRNRISIEDAGIVYVFVQHLTTGYRRFCVFRRDQSKRDFSWRDAIYLDNKVSRISQICRHLIDLQIEAFREANFTGTCTLCGKPIAKCHVDHIPPATFEVLIHGWLHTLRMDPSDVAIVTSPNYGQNSCFEDPVLEPTWVEYHSINARLRCLCQSCNLSVTRKREVDRGR
jgi:hypothetical protein